MASKNSPYYWDLKGGVDAKSVRAFFKKYDKFGESDYMDLADYCGSLGIDFLSTPFDAKSVDFLDSIMSYYKIASADINNLPFLRQIAKKQKPVVLSTGASTLKEIASAVKCLESHGATSVVLLHCFKLSYAE